MKKLFSLFVLLMVAVGGYAQSDDFGVYSTLSVEKKIDKKASVGVEAEMRTRENLSTFDRWSIGVDGSYKLTKWLKASAGYTLLYDNNEKRLPVDHHHQSDGFALPCRDGDSLP